MAERRRNWSVSEILAWTADRFARADLPSARLDAEVLLAKVLDCQRIDLYTDPQRPLADEERTRYRSLVKRRLAGEPVAYLVGRREFWSLSLAVDAGVLVPRPETETLVEEALDLLRPVPSPRILDAGTGSGAVALALKKERPDARVFALDASADALRRAADNSRRLALDVRFLRADWLTAVAATAALDLIVSNPPYQRPAEITAGLAHEPRAALDGGPDGLRIVRRLIAEAPARLGAGGRLAVEIAPDQAGRVLALLAESGWSDARCRKDLGRRDRVVSARRPAPAGAPA